MSNQTVGTVYQQIIRDVVDSSRVDFEEGGVDESVLDELSRVWQQKLTALSVAQFPWDPKPEAPPPQQNMANIPSTMSYPQDPTPDPMQQQQQQQAPPQQGQYVNRPGQQAQAQAPQFPQMPQMPQMNAGPRIKAEPGLETGGMPPAYTGMGNATTAQQRAALNLQASYGARAAASINAIQGMPQQGQQQQGQPQQQQGQPQQQQQQPQQQPNQQQAQQQAQQQQQMHQAQQAQQRPQGTSIPRPQMTPSQYQQALAQQAAHQKQQLEQQAKARQQAAAQAQQQQGQGAPNGAQHAQTDGGADEDEDRHRHFGVVKQVGGDGSEINMGRVELDGLIRRQIEARGKAMEGGGLMLPLKQQKGSAGGGRRERKRVGQTDGGDDDDDDDDDKVLKAEDDDEDAINSDLDDPDDPKSDDSGDDETPQVMLCMYDKVQRVKNKWKCVMKDGVLTINGKDYVFHKASGEYEW